MSYKFMIEKIFTIETLPSEVKEEILEQYRDINVEDDWWYEYIIEYWVAELEKMGFIELTISFSGFWSQGDGASFIAKSIDVEVYMKAHKLGKKYRAALNAAKQGYVQLSLIRDRYYRYVHENTLHVVDETLNVSEKAQIQVNVLCDHVLEEAKQLSRKIYKELQEQYEYSTSDESIIETLLANDYQFNGQGKLI